MKKLSLIILVLLFLFACADDRITQIEAQIPALETESEAAAPDELSALQEQITELEAELAELQQNDPPAVSISRTVSIVDNGSFG